MTALVALPIFAPLALALMALVTPRWSGRRIALGIAFAALFGFSVWLMLHVHHHGPMVHGFGGWAVPYGIVLVGDSLATIMVSLSSLTALVAVLFGYAEQRARDEHPLRLPLLLLLVTGVNHSFLTGDLFNLFVAFEVFLLASYALLTLEIQEGQARNALPYVAINLVGSALLLMSCAFAYGLFGTLNMAEMAERAAGMVGDSRVDLLGLMLMLVFGMKAGVFPLYYWLPRSYPAMTTPILAFHGAMLTKVGIYALARLFGTILPGELVWLHEVLMWAAGLTMVIGGLGALAQSRIQQILVYHVVSQVGYLVLAIGWFSIASYGALIFYVAHLVMVKAGLLFIGGIVRKAQGDDLLKTNGGLQAAAPVLSLCFLALALSLAGIPPLSGFWGKFMIVRVGLAQGEVTLVVLALVASVLTLLSMLKIWLGAFWKPAPEGVRVVLNAQTRGMTAAVGILVAASLAMGFGANAFVKLAQDAAEETFSRTTYSDSVRALNLVPVEGKRP
jgi:multicomponent Na+:H+ antiporter subunit D